jgi:hypothetical protein
MKTLKKSTELTPPHTISPKKKKNTIDPFSRSLAAS